MRIISGTLGGRIIESPQTNRTHPMSDRVRGGLFNVLGDISNLRVLDAFAGSGALSLEAISRGARAATAIDIDKKAYDVINKNARRLSVTAKIKVVCADAGSWSDRNSDVNFDIVISAPPYDDLQPELVAKLTRHVGPGGIYVLDWPGKQEPPILPGLKKVANKHYGDAQIVFFKRV